MALTSLSLKQLRRKTAAAIGGFEWGAVTSLTADTMVVAPGKLSGRTPQTYSGWYLFRPDNMSSSGNPASVTGDRVKVVTQFVPSTRTFTHSFGNSDYTGITATGTALDISDASYTTPIVITTVNSHGFASGDTVTISDVAGNTNANGIWTITVTGASTFELDGSTGNAAYSAADDHVQRNEMFELHRYLDPDDPYNGWLSAINRGMSRLYHKTLLPLTPLVVDGDMQRADATYAWTPTGSATVTKDTAPGSTVPYIGMRSLRTLYTATSEVVTSALINVTEGQGYSVGALVRGMNASFAPKLEVYDSTNSAIIDTFDIQDASGNDTAQMKWCFINGAVTIPNNCRQVTLRLGTTALGTGIAGAAWGGIWFQEQAANRWALPSTVTDRAQVLGVQQIGNVSWNPETWTLLEVQPDRIWFDPMAANPGSIHLAQKATRFMFLELWQPFPAFSTLVGHAGHDDQAVSIDERLAVAAIKAEALHLIKNTGRYLTMPYQGDIDRAIVTAETEFASLSHLSQRPAPKVRPHVWVGTR